MQTTQGKLLNPNTECRESSRTYVQENFQTLIIARNSKIFAVSLHELKVRDEFK